MSTPGTAPGILWGVGVGPGDPDLLTVKAARVLSDTRVVAHFAKKGNAGTARTIAGPHLRPDWQELRLDYPFTTELEVGAADYTNGIEAFYDTSAARIAGYLDAGEPVAVLCEGDPFFYGSYMYLHDRLAGRYEARVIPGITGMGGCWAVAGTPITRWNDVMTVIPATLPEEALAQRLATTDAAVFMKVGRHLPKVRAALAAAGALDRAVYVERGTMANQKVVALADRPADEAAPYFSIVLVPGRGVRR
ncbi:MAG: precorrin-2 C(20)-methyltransferase [Rhodospirillaceae bacterium]|nr:precorrin-2 C(20)-methyltransferase [Rhodospirillaceae bacterium]